MATFFGFEKPGDGDYLMKVKALFPLGDDLMIKLSENVEMELAAQRFYFELSRMNDFYVLHVPKVQAGFPGLGILAAKEFEVSKDVIPPEHQAWLAAKPGRGCIVMERLNPLTPEQREKLQAGMAGVQKVMLRTVVEDPASGSDVVVVDVNEDRLLPPITFNPFWNRPFYEQSEELGSLVMGVEEPREPGIYSPMCLFATDIGKLKFSPKVLVEEMGDLFGEAMFGARRAWDFFGVRIVMTSKGPYLINFDCCNDLRNREDGLLVVRADESLFKMFKVNNWSAARLCRHFGKRFARKGARFMPRLASEIKSIVRPVDEVDEY